MTWLENIGKWFVENKETILAVLTAIQSSGLIGFIAWAVKSTKQVKLNTKTTETLNKSITCVDGLNGEVAEMKDVNKVLIEKCDYLENQMNDLKNSMDILITKIDAIIEVQSVVYTTIKDDKTRATVNNLLTNAKYAVTEQRKKLIDELESLRQQIKAQAEAQKQLVEHAVNKAQSIVKVEDAPVEEQVVTRY
jgi:hypothetical protein